jgi:hypothetical protein
MIACSESVMVWAKSGRGAMRRKTKAGTERTLRQPSAPTGFSAVTVTGDLRNDAASNDGGARIRRLVVLAYLLAVSIPPLGLILGIALSLRAGRRYSLHGVLVIALSIIMGIVWIGLLSSGAFSTPSTSY